MSTNLAPIGISTYARLQHLQQTIATLQKNALAEQSELFVFSDAPRAGDEEKVASVRGYLRTVDGFKAVHIIERESNSRTANSRGGLRMLLDRFGKVIFLEEDIITAPGFLTYMNQALEKYEGNDRVFSVAGYCPPINIPANYKHDAFFLRRYNGWGLGIWKNRYDRIKYITPEEYEQFAADKKRAKSFVENGMDMLGMLKLDAYGEIDAGDVKAMYAQFLSGQYTVYPSKSLTRNIGFDGTGTQCGESSRFDVIQSDKTTFCLPECLIVDRRIVKSHREFWGDPYGYARQGRGNHFIRRVINKLAIVSGAGRIRNEIDYRRRYRGSVVHGTAHVMPDVSMGAGVRIESGARLSNSILAKEVTVAASNSINGSSLGERSKIYSGCNLQKVTCEHDVALYGGHFNEVTIGCYSYIAAQAAMSMVTIGRFCSIGPHLICGYGDHPTDFASTSPVFFSPEKQCGVSFTRKKLFEERKPIHIGHDVWIGARVFIRDGVKIGNGAVIAAGSVVVKDVPDYAIVGGMPAKLIRYRFNEEIIAELLKLKWWEWSEDKLRKAQPYMAQNNVLEFIEWASNIDKSQIPKS